MITKFKVFESIRDHMKPVSMDDIKKKSSIERLDWLFHLSNYNEERETMKNSLPSEFFPTSEELKKDLAELPNDSARILAIIKHHLPYTLLPNSELVINEKYLNWEAFGLDELPDNLTINGDVNFGMNNFTEIKNLTVNGNISFHENYELNKIGSGVKISGYLCLSDCQYLTEISPDIYVGSYLDISECDSLETDKYTLNNIRGEIRTEYK